MEVTLARVTSRSSATRPRVATTSSGRLRRFIQPSKITQASTGLRSAARKRLIASPPVSSSPSQTTRNETGSGRRRRVKRSPRAASRAVPCRPRPRARRATRPEARRRTGRSPRARAGPGAGRRSGRRRGRPAPGRPAIPPTTSRPASWRSASPPRRRTAPATHSAARVTSAAGRVGAHARDREELAELVEPPGREGRAIARG